ncbi:MAG: fucose isomerase [Candidatus Bipolaricaulota bacterium]
MKKIGVIVRASALHDRERVHELRDQILQDLRAASGLDVEETAQPSSDHLSAILVLTGGVERDVLKVVAQLPSPTLLIAHPGHNSLPASLEVLARIRQDGGEGRILYGSPESIGEGLRQELALANAWERFRFSRIGVIGDPSDWLVASDVDRAFLKGRLSIDVVHLAMEQLLERVETADAPRKDISAFVKGARFVAEATGDDVRAAVRIYHGLRELVDEHRLSACTLRCFDLVKKLNNTGCYALSRLNDEGIPAGCEGDLQSLFSLYLAFLLSGSTAFMANIADVDAERRTLGVAHCMCPLSMAPSYAIRSHFESGIGVGIAGTLPPGPCTLFRLGGERLSQLFVREGTLVESTMREDLCRTQARVSINGEVDGLLTTPLGNHHILLGGHHRETIERFFERYLAS